MPYYLRTFSDQNNIFANIRQHILDAQTGELFNEPRLFLMEELREPRNYFSILRAIAQGNTRLNKIAQASAVGAVTMIAHYLDLLQQMRLITRRIPGTEFQPEKSKRGIYQIDDHLLHFFPDGFDIGFIHVATRKFNRLFQPLWERTQKFNHCISLPDRQNGQNEHSPILQTGCHNHYINSMAFS